MTYLDASEERKKLEWVVIDNIKYEKTFDLEEFNKSIANAKVDYEALVISDLDEKPTIAVMDNQAHFNITRGATFDSIIFRGDYGMLEDTSIVSDKSTVRMCSVDESKDLLTYNAILLNNESNPADIAADVDLHEYKCDQVYF